MKKVALYLRVSTSEQTTKNQRRELEAAAKRLGLKIVQVFEDAGISGMKGKHKRPGFAALLNAIALKKVDVVMATSVDRLSRSLADLVDFLSELHACEVDLVILKQGLNTQTPAGKAMFQLLGVFAEFERAMIRERVMSGLARARADGTRLGRPRVGPEVEAAILRERASGKGMRRIARDLGIGCSVVQRVIHASRRKQGRRAA